MHPLIKIGIVTGSLYSLDYLLRKTKYFQRKNSRWYLIHHITNMYIVSQTTNDMLQVFKTPLMDIMTPRSNPMFIMSSLHLYHMIAFYDKLKFDDWWHHVINCFVVAYITNKCQLGIMVNYFLFFMCGLPGGIDYGLLTLNELGLIKRITEKRINKYLNMWIRLPGILFGCSIGWVNLMTKDLSNPIKYSIISIGLLNIYNGIYFASQVVENYGISKNIML